MQMIFNSIS